MALKGFILPTMIINIFNCCMVSPGDNIDSMKASFVAYLDH